MGVLYLLHTNYVVIARARFFRPRQSPWGRHSCVSAFPTGIALSLSLLAKTGGIGLRRVSERSGSLSKRYSALTRMALVLSMMARVSHVFTEVAMAASRACRVSLWRNGERPSKTQWLTAFVGWASPTSGVHGYPVWWAMPTLQVRRLK